MSKKLKLSLIEREILWTLEAAGEERLPALEITVKNIVDEYSDEFFSHSLNNLERIEFIKLETDEQNNINVVLTNKGIISLTK